MVVEILCVFAAMFLFLVSCGFCFYAGTQFSKMQKVKKPKSIIAKKKSEKEEKELDPISQGIANIFAFDGKNPVPQNSK